MNRQFYRFCLYLVLLFLATGCTKVEQHTTEPLSPHVHLSAEEKPVHLVQATDLHYLSSQLTDNGEFFTNLVEDADGKNMLHIEEITEAFVADMIAEQPEVLILSGDITFNGEKQSHIDLEKKLSRLQKNGIQVLIMPGNHDVDRSSAARFTKDGYELVDSISKEDFADLYHRYGLQQALHKDDNSLSYIYQARSDFWILMLDSNADKENRLSDATIKWTEKMLQEAQEKHIQVLAVSHQNIAHHHSDFDDGFVIHQSDKIRAFYQQYGVLLNLSGHIHIQHIVDEQTPEIITSALSVSPHQYGQLQYDGQQISYKTKEISVENWAKDQGMTDDSLLQFSKHSRAFMERVAAKKIEDDLSRLSATEQEKVLMKQTFAAVNADYFAGNPISLDEHQAGLNLSRNYKTPFTSSYLDIILESGKQSQKTFVKVVEKK